MKVRINFYELTSVIVQQEIEKLKQLFNNVHKLLMGFSFGLS